MAELSPVDDAATVYSICGRLVWQQVDYRIKAGHYVGPTNLKTRYRIFVRENFFLGFFQKFEVLLSVSLLRQIEWTLLKIQTGKILNNSWA